MSERRCLNHDKAWGTCQVIDQRECRDDGPIALSDQMGEAVQRQMQRAQASAFIDRRGWTDDQWVDDAERLMNEPDGAITSLVNGHVMALLRRVRAVKEDTDVPGT